MEPLKIVEADATLTLPSVGSSNSLSGSSALVIDGVNDGTASFSTGLELSEKIQIFPGVHPYQIGSSYDLRDTFAVTDNYAYLIKGHSARG